MQAVSDLLGMQINEGVKTLVVKGTDTPVVALVLRGDHELNAIKAEKFDQVKAPLEFADEKDIRAAIGCGPGSIGPVGLKVPAITDHSAAALANFSSGANEDGYHYIGVNWGRDLPEPELVADIRNVVEGDASPTGDGKLEIQRGIEVGHICLLYTSPSPRD